MIQIMGSLDLPLSTPSSLTLLRFTCLDGSGNVLKTASQEIETDTDGNYDFGLNNGQYCIEVLYGKTWEYVASVEVTDLTTSPIDLNGLIEEAGMPEPEPSISVSTYRTLVVTDTSGEAQIQHDLDSDYVMVQVWEDLIPYELSLTAKITELSNNSILLDGSPSTTYKVIVIG